MTLILGFAVRDGLVLASDSREKIGSEPDAKRDTAQKLFPLGPFAAMVAAGSWGQMSLVAEALQEGLLGQRRNRLTRRTIYKVIYDTLLEFHEEYNVALREATDDKEVSFFDPDVIVGVSLDGERQWLYEATVRAPENPPLTVELVPDYAAQGSCGIHADPLLHLLYSRDLSLSATMRLAAYLVATVAEVTSDCGGPPQVAVLKEGVQVVETPDVERELSLVRPRLDRLLKTLASRALSEELSAKEVERQVRQALPPA